MLTRDQILNALNRLNNELADLDMSGELLLTGGASMCLVHSARDMTKDIDALYEPKTIINKIVAKVAEEEGLPEDWLNDGVKGFVSNNAPHEDFLVLSNLTIGTVSADYLLAMKLMSARYGETDYEDIKFLMNNLEIRTEEEMKEIIMRYYQADTILPKTKYIIEELISEKQY